MVNSCPDWSLITVTNVTIQESELIRAISPNDQMFASPPGENYYFSCGRSALECIDVSLQAAQKDPLTVKRVLDLPCGHGRVLRYLKAAFPQAEITACDILRDGVDFCATTFGAVPVYSCDDPAQIPLDRDAFDLIWVGSLFTHLDSNLWPTFLAEISSLLCQGGVLVFSTHGRDAYYKMLSGMHDAWLPQDRRTQLLYRYEHTGFGYSRFSGSDDYYGLSLSQPGWVLAQIAGIRDLRLAHFSERSWAAFHDVFACVRDSAWQPAPSPVRVG
jgi:SAM-dependent methyltransferase